MKFEGIMPKPHKKNHPKALWFLRFLGYFFLFLSYDVVGRLFNHL